MQTGQSVLPTNEFNATQKLAALQAENDQLMQKTLAQQTEIAQLKSQLESKPKQHEQRR